MTNSAAKRTWVKPVILILAVLAIISSVFILLNQRFGAEAAADGQEISYMAVSGCLAYKSMDDLAIESTLVIRGKVTGRSEAFRIVPVHDETEEYDGEPMNYTDVYIEPLEIYRGETDQEQLSVRIMGGLAGNVLVTADAEPELKQGNEYILFLTQPNMGGGYNTQGDYYYVCGAMQGCFEQMDSSFKAKSGEALRINTLKTYIASMNKKHPADKALYKNTFLSNLELNLESGFITQEEYGKFLAESNRYATILE